MSSFFLGWIYWNPPRDLFHLPLIQHPVSWYGILFVVGLLLSYFVMEQRLRYFLKLSREESRRLCDRFLWTMAFALLVGARFGHILFYEPLYYLDHPAEIVKTWHGGLASHGAALAIPLALCLFSWYYRPRYPQLTFLALFDLLAIPVPLCGFFIRLGNFVNQEIVGAPSQLPWAVLFALPAEGGVPVPRHPVQLYEALGYLTISFFLFLLGRRTGKASIGAGLLSGWMLLLLFGSRFIFEVFKAAQGGWMELGPLSSGQWLSLPFLMWGLFLVWRGSGSIHPSAEHPADSIRKESRFQGF